MSKLFYQENVKSRARFVNNKATEYYCKHYQIALILKATIKNTTDCKNRMIANEQLSIAERKMMFWERKEEFDMKQALSEIAKMKNCNFANVCVDFVN